MRELLKAARVEPYPSLADILRAASEPGGYSVCEFYVPKTAEETVLVEGAMMGLLKCKPGCAGDPSHYYTLTDAGRAFIGLPPRVTFRQQVGSFLRQLRSLIVNYRHTVKGE